MPVMRPASTGSAPPTAPSAPTSSDFTARSGDAGPDRASSRPPISKPPLPPGRSGRQFQDRRRNRWNPHPLPVRTQRSRRRPPPSRRRMSSRCRRTRAGSRRGIRERPTSPPFRGRTRPRTTRATRGSLGGKTNHRCSPRPRRSPPMRRPTRPSRHRRSVPPSRGPRRTSGRATPPSLPPTRISSTSTRVRAAPRGDRSLLPRGGRPARSGEGDAVSGPRPSTGIRPPWRCDRAGGRDCERRESNPHALRHWNLNPARLPVSPLSRG